MKESLFGFSNLSRFPELVHGISRRWMLGGEYEEGAEQGGDVGAEQGGGFDGSGGGAEQGGGAGEGDGERGVNGGGAEQGEKNLFNISFEFGESGQSLVLKNRQQFFELLGGGLQILVSAHQTHSDHIATYREGDDVPEIKNAEDEVYDVDAFITDVPGIGLMVKTADCQPILMFAPGKEGSGHSLEDGEKSDSERGALKDSGCGASGRPVVAAVHSGWRGSLKNIAGKTVQKMVDEFGVDPRKLIVGVGPSLGPCCAEFSNPEEELTEEALRYRVMDGEPAGAGAGPETGAGLTAGAGLETGAGLTAGAGPEKSAGRPTNRFDFWAMTREQLLSEGVREENMEFAEICTACHTDEWFSYRGDHPDVGRFGSVIGLV